jgi:hypothetical protein
MQEEHEKLLRMNSLQKLHCQNQLYFNQKYIQKAKCNSNSTGVYHGSVGSANVGNQENAHISVDKKEA